VWVRWHSEVGIDDGSLLVGVMVYRILIYVQCSEMNVIT